MLVFQFKVQNHFSSLCPYQICFSCVCAFVTTDLLIDFQPLSNICEVWFYLWLYTKLGWGEQAPLRLAHGVFLETLAGKCLTTGVTICRSGNFSAVTNQVTCRVRPAQHSWVGRDHDALRSLKSKYGNTAVHSGSRQLPGLKVVLKMLE